MRIPRHSIEELRSALSYDRDTGEFRWLIDRTRAAKKGTVAGRTCRHGGAPQINYRGKTYSSAQLAWAFEHGEWPKSATMFFRNGNCLDNRLSNIKPLESGDRDDAAIGLKRRVDPLKRFFAKVQKTDGCWLWTATRNEDGYGRFLPGGGVRRPIGAHVFSYREFVGPTNDLCVLHRCDTPACVNPAHLFLGTQADNMRDMTAKGRGTKCKGAAKLNPDKVRNIRLLGLGAMARLAREYGVTESCIRQVIDGSTWRDVVVALAERRNEGG